MQPSAALSPNVAKVGGLQSQGVKKEIVVAYLDPSFAMLFMQQ